MKALRGPCTLPPHLSPVRAGQPRLLISETPPRPPGLAGPRLMEGHTTNTHRTGTGAGSNDSFLPLTPCHLHSINLLKLERNRKAALSSMQNTYAEQHILPNLQEYQASFHATQRVCFAFVFGGAGNRTQHPPILGKCSYHRATLPLQSYIVSPFYVCLFSSTGA